mgnify:CR=1 FL=1
MIIAHGFRKPFLNQAIRVAKKTNSKIFLVTHAPFVEKKLRSWRLNLLVRLYDLFYAKRVLNRFDKILTITKWELPFLYKLFQMVFQTIFLKKNQ